MLFCYSRYFLKRFIIFVLMNVVYAQLGKENRLNAIQRLTALWAFTESGLGGIMHALQIPFTGLVVGGMAIIMISLITDIAENNYKQVLKSALIVLIVKAMVSPYTPFPAYIAVSFQALLGYIIFSLLKVNFISILLLSCIAMLESAVQKIIILTLFFGESLWKAIDNMLAWVANQFGSQVLNGSYWLLGIYLFIYLAGGFFVGWLAHQTIKNFDKENGTLVLHTVIAEVSSSSGSKLPARKFYKKLAALVILMLCLAVISFIFSANYTQGWLAAAKTISWTLSAILIWFIFISPLLTKAIQKLLRKKQSRYRDEVLKTLSFLPVLSRLTALAWQQNKQHSGFKRWSFFISLLIHATLTYAEPVPSEFSINDPA